MDYIQEGGPSSNSASSLDSDCTLVERSCHNSPIKPNSRHPRFLRQSWFYLSITRVLKRRSKKLPASHPLEGSSSKVHFSEVDHICLMPMRSPDEPASILTQKTMMMKTASQTSLELDSGDEAVSKESWRARSFNHLNPLRKTSYPASPFKAFRLIRKLSSRKQPKPILRTGSTPFGGYIYEVVPRSTVNEHYSTHTKQYCCSLDSVSSGTSEDDQCDCGYEFLERRQSRLSDAVFGGKVSNLGNMGGLGRRSFSKIRK